MAEFTDSMPLESALLAIRGFYGLMFAFHLMRPGVVHSLAPRDLRLPVYQTDGSEIRFDHRQTAPADLAAVFDSIGPEPVLLRNSRDFAREFFMEEMPKVAAACAHAPLFDNKLLRASAWLFDSHAGHNVLLKYVQAAVSLETLLGDKKTSDLTGLGVLLGNRCAYLIGKSRKQRDEIVEDFRRIYDTRSRIVHSGQNRLTSAELRDLSRLRWMVGRVIQEEVRLLLADK